MHPKKESIIQSNLHRESIKALTGNKNFVVTGLQVTAGPGLTVNISAGSCIVGGVYIEFNNSVLTLPASSTVFVYVALTLDAGKPVDATITYVSASFSPDETKLLLAMVTTSSSNISGVSDRRIYRIRGMKTTYTSSGSEQFSNAWIYAIIVGGAGGGYSNVPSGYNATGGCGGQINIQIVFHHAGLLQWVVGSGGAPGSPPNSGGLSSLWYIPSPGASSISITASGGAGAQISNTVPLSIGSSLIYYDATISFETQLYSGPNIIIHGLIVPAYQLISTAGSNYKIYSGAYASKVGNPVIVTSGATHATNTVSTSGVTLSSGGNSSTSTGSYGTGGQIIAYIWEI